MWRSYWVDVSFPIVQESLFSTSIWCAQILEWKYHWPCGYYQGNPTSSLWGRLARLEACHRIRLNLSEAEECFTTIWCITKIEPNARELKVEVHSIPLNRYHYCFRCDLGWVIEWASDFWTYPYVFWAFQEHANTYWNVQSVPMKPIV